MTEERPAGAASPRPVARVPVVGGQEVVVFSLLFLALVAVYLANGTRFLGGDTLGSPYAALNLLRKGNFYLESLVRGYPPYTYWILPTPRGTVSMFGFGTPIVALPVFALLDGLLWHGHWTENRLLLAGKVAGALMTAGAALLLAITARRFVSRLGAVAVALAFGLCSSAWSISSQGLWKHSAAGLLIASGLALAVWPREQRDQHAVAMALSAVPFTFSGWCRENLVLVAVAAAVYLAVVVRGRRVLAGFLALAALTGGLLLVLNAAHFGSPLISAQRIIAAQDAARERVQAWDTPLWLGVYGLLLSPSRGLFIFSPLFLASVAGLWLGRRSPERATWFFLGAAALLAAAPGFKWHWWWGGHNYGPRTTVDSMPLLALLLVPTWNHLTACRPGQRRAWGAALGVLALFSLLVQGIGVLRYDGRAWDEPAPALSVNAHPERALRWSDSQLLFYLRWPPTRPERIPWR